MYASEVITHSSVSVHNVRCSVPQYSCSTMKTVKSPTRFLVSGDIFNHWKGQEENNRLRKYEMVAVWHQLMVHLKDCFIIYWSFVYRLLCSKSSTFSYQLSLHDRNFTWDWNYRKNNSQWKKNDVDFPLLRNTFQTTFLLI